MTLSVVADGKQYVTPSIPRRPMRENAKLSCIQIIKLREDLSLANLDRAWIRDIEPTWSRGLRGSWTNRESLIGTNAKFEIKYRFGEQGSGVMDTALYAEYYLEMTEQTLTR